MSRCLLGSIVALVAVLTTAPRAAIAQTSAEPQSNPSSSAPAAGTLTAQRASYAIFVRGARVGAEDLSVERTDTGWLIKGTGRFATPLNMTLRDAEISYGFDLQPQRLRLVGLFRDQSLDLTTTFSATTASNAFVEGEETKTVDVPISPGTIVLPNNFFGAFAGLGARLVTLQPGAELRVYVAPVAEITAVLNEVFNERVQTASRSFGVRRHRLTLHNPSGPVQIEVETEDDGKLLRVVVPDGQVVVAREDVASVAARQQRFVREGDEDVRIPGNGFSLAATISRPATIPPPPAGKKTTRLPAMVLVPGAGALDRDHFVAGIPVFGQLASRVADAGHLVIRYDTRGVGQSGGRSEAAGLNDYAEDVVGIVRWLSNRDDVDAQNITVVGHDAGAWVALLAAAREKRIARVGLLAAASVSGGDLMLEQQQSTLARLSIPPEEKQARVALQLKIHEAVTKGGSWEGIPADLKAQADTPLFASMLTFDPARAISRVRQPIVIVAGELDRQVPVQHAEKLAALAKARKNDRGVTLVTVPGVNHLLVPAKTGEVDEYAWLADRNISPQVVTAITANPVAAR